MTQPFINSGKRHNAQSVYRYVVSGSIIALLLISLFLISLVLDETANSVQTSSSIPKDNIFQYPGIHEIHLEFKDTTSLKKLAPYGGIVEANPWFNIAAFISPVFYASGDKNFDRQFTHEEFMSLSERWFKDWDAKGEGMLSADMITNGYNKETVGLDLRGAPGRPNGIASILDVHIPSGKASVRIDDQSIPAASIRHKGNGTLLQGNRAAKYSFKIDVNDSFPGRSVAGVSKINLHNLVMDPGYMTDVISYRLFRDAKVPAPRTGYAKVYASIPGSLNNHYMGLYLLLENVDNDFAMHWFGTKKGAIFKPVTPSLFQYMGDDWDNYIQTFDPKTPVSSQETNRIIEVCKFVSTASDEEFSEKITEYFDIDNLARFIAVDVLLVDLDGILGPGQNMYLYLHPKTFQLSLIPWDHDQSFGRMPRGTLIERDSLSIHKPWTMGNIFMERLFKAPQFKALYLQYMKEFNETLFRPERILSQVEELVPVLRPAVEQESKEKLKKFDLNVGLVNGPIEIVIPRPGAEPQPVKSLRQFVVGRHKSVSDQLAGKSSGVVFRPMPPLPFGGNLFLAKMDNNKDSLVSYEEFRQTFESWYSKWADPGTGIITYEGLADGISNDISPFGPNPRKVKLGKNPEE